MDDDGFVPLGLLANFNKMLQLTNDIELITAIASNSEIIEYRDGFVRLRSDYGPWILPAEVYLFYHFFLR
jgi:la-related protein 1